MPRRLDPDLGTYDAKLESVFSPGDGVKLLRDQVLVNADPRFLVPQSCVGCIVAIVETCDQRLEAIGVYVTVLGGGRRCSREATSPASILPLCNLRSQSTMTPLDPTPVHDYDRGINLSSSYIYEHAKVGEAEQGQRNKDRVMMGGLIPDRSDYAEIGGEYF